MIMAGALLWMASASLLTTSIAMANEDLPLSCTWLDTILSGCADDSFTFPEFTGWDLLKRHFYACLYVREDATGVYDCRQPGRFPPTHSNVYFSINTQFKTIVSCKMEAYLNAKECLSKTLDHYRRNFTVAATAEVKPATHGKYSHGHSTGVQGHNVEKPNITIEYTHYV